MAQNKNKKTKLTTEELNRLVKEVLMEIAFRNEQGQVKLPPMHPTGGTGESQPVEDEEDDEKQQGSGTPTTTAPVSRSKAPDLDPSKLAGMKMHPKMSVSERKNFLLKKAIREALALEVFKDPGKTKKYIKQLAGNLETGDIGFKNLLKARKDATDDDERDEIQGLIDKHPKTKKSMYKA